MKYLPTMSQEEFLGILPTLPVSTLKNLLQGIFSMCNTTDDRVTLAMRADLERKQTKIWGELQRRGILNEKTNQEFMRWLYGTKIKRLY